MRRFFLDDAGVDLNYAPAHILRRVSGIGESTSKAVVEWRRKHGRFHSRESLRKVKGLGEHAFRQCAGFVRIFPEEAQR